MAKVSSVEKNNRRKKIVDVFKNKRNRLREIVRSKDVSPKDRFDASVKLAKYPKNSTPARIRNRCAKTGRPRGFYRRIGMSRCVFRLFAAEGLLPGVVRSSW